MYATTFVGNLTGNVSGTVSGRAGSADKLTSQQLLDLQVMLQQKILYLMDKLVVPLKTFTTSISNQIVAGKTVYLQVLEMTNYLLTEFRRYRIKRKIRAEFVKCCTQQS